MAIHIIVKKQHLYVFALLVVFLVGAVMVSAFGSGGPPATIGHSVDELDTPTCGGSDKLTDNGAGMICAADVNTDTNTQCDDQNCGTVDVNGLENSDSSEIDINSDNLLMGTAGGGFSRDIAFTNGGRRFAIFLDNSINNGNLIIEDDTSGTDKIRIQEGAGDVDFFVDLANPSGTFTIDDTAEVTGTLTVNGGGVTVFRCNACPSFDFLAPSSGDCSGCGSFTDTGLRVS